MKKDAAVTEGLPSPFRPVVPDVNKNLKPLTNKIEPKLIDGPRNQRGHGWWAV